MAASSDYCAISYTKKWRFFEDIHTDNLSGINRKIAEFYNTLIRFFLKSYQTRKRNAEALNLSKNNYLEFIYKNGIVPTNSANLDARIFLDITFTITQSSITGIPRVVSELAKIGKFHGLRPFFIFAGELYCLSADASHIQKLNYEPGDIFIFADAGWNYLDDIQRVFGLISTSGGYSVCIIHDLIPLIYPQLSNPDHVHAFKLWLDALLKNNQDVICVSKAVSDEFLSLISCNDNKPNSIKNVGYNHLGCNYAYANNSNVSNHIVEICNKSVKIFLSVGTIEPRKGYSISIDAIEKTWGRNIDFIYIIVGKYGWSQDLLRERILSHSEYGRRLYWFDCLNDIDLCYLYKNSHALVSSTLCEGFGLPLIEASYHQLSCIVSDIPVFREIGGRSTQYFEVTNSHHLANLLSHSINNPKIAPDVDVISWDDSVMSLLSMVINKNYQYRLS